MDVFKTVVPKDYGYVVLTLASTAVVSLYHSVMAGSLRKPAKVPYPRLYADTFEIPTGAKAKGLSAEALELKRAEYKYNCAQRAHAQFLEQMPIFVPTLLLSGLKWPVLTSSMGAAFLVNRLIFQWGYVNSSKTEGKGRYIGGLYLPIELALVGMTAKMGYDIVFG